LQDFLGEETQKVHTGTLPKLAEDLQKLHYQHAQDFSIKQLFLVEFWFRNLPFDG